MIAGRKWREKKKKKRGRKGKRKKKRQRQKMAENLKGARGPGRAERRFNGCGAPRAASRPFFLRGCARGATVGGGGARRFGGGSGSAPGSGESRGGLGESWGFPPPPVTPAAPPGCSVCCLSSWWRLQQLCRLERLRCRALGVTRRNLGDFEVEFLCDYKRVRVSPGAGGITHPPPAEPTSQTGPPVSPECVLKGPRAPPGTPWVSPDPRVPSHPLGTGPCHPECPWEAVGHPPEALNTLRSHPRHRRCHPERPL